MFSHSATRSSSGKDRVPFLDFVFVLFFVVVLGFFVGFVCLYICLGFLLVLFHFGSVRLVSSL